MKKTEVNLRKSYSSSDIIRILEDDGWQHKDTDGSHWQFKHETKKGKVTVKHPDKDVPLPTLKSILKQAGLLSLLPLL